VYCGWNDFVFDAFLNLEPVEWLWQVICDETYRSSSDSTSESILDELETIDLDLVEIVVERVTVVRFRTDYENGNGGSGFKDDKWADGRDLGKERTNKQNPRLWAVEEGRIGVTHSGTIFNEAVFSVALFTY
jgi:hypothetical protein